jgi:HD-like signal output (HDOD) protein
MAVVAVSLVNRVEELVSLGEFQLPPVPELALRLRTALEDASTDREEIVDLIRSDPTVTVTLLKTANSAALGFRATNDPSQAISRLGLRQVQAIVTAVQVQGQFETNQDSNKKALETLWNHAIGSAAVAKTLAKRVDYDAFLAGLLHGIGRLIVLRALDHLAQVDKDLVLTPSAIDELAEALQYEMGYSTLRNWNFDDDICEAAHAMSPDLAASTEPIIRIVQAADLIVQKLGMHPLPDPDLDLLGQGAIQSFEISEAEMDALLVELQSEIDEVKSAFGAA